MKKTLITLLFVISFINNTIAADLYPIEDKRVDSLTVKHIEISMDMRNIGAKKFAASTLLSLTPKMNNIQHVTLDLRNHVVDSVYCNGVNVQFTRKPDKVQINLNKSYNIGENIGLTVYYHGLQATDASGFGGFYFTGDYAYAVGVGFQADPHPFGRSWFPCFDNFNMKSTYSYKITTDTGFAAICGGGLVSNLTTDSTILWHYQLDNPIPSYLASMSVSKYELLKGSFNTSQGNVPYILAALAKDTGKLKGSFLNLEKALKAFIFYFGDYQWQRVGYNVVPFNGGAMEHACNITYPLFAIDSSTDREELMAHELAHAWWGNNITCKTQEDMWINEGWASYGEKLFNEFVYGKDAYRQKVEETHREVLQFAHIADGQILPVSGIGHSNTYGRHVYKKGADVAHTLRGYMGDSAFFTAIKNLMKNNRYGNIDSKEMMDSFQKFTKVDLSYFYNGWVIGKGFPHLAVKDWRTKKVGNNYETEVSVLQRTRWDLAPFEEIPMEITLMSADLTKITKKVMVGKYQSNFKFDVPFETKWVGIDMDAKIADATTDTFRYINNVGNYSFNDGLMNINVSAINKPSFVHVTHNWIHADKSTQIESLPVLSTQRYWTVGGVFDDNFKATATINYNGQTQLLNGDFFLDNYLIKGVEDSLTLMYRKDMSSPWEMANADKVMGANKFDRQGSFIIKQLKVGEYCLAMYSNALEVAVIDDNNSNILIYPNPARNEVHIEFISFTSPGYIIITDSLGRIMMKRSIRNTQNNIDIDTKEWPSGNYKVVLQYPEGKSTGASIVITK